MTIWFVSILPTWCPTVPGPLSTPRKSIQPLDTVWSVWPTDIDTHFCEAAIEWHPTVCCNDCMCPMGGTCFCTGLCESYNGSCEIWTDTLLLSLLLSLSFSLDHTRPVPSSVTRCYYFDEVFLTAYLCTHTNTVFTHSGSGVLVGSVIYRLELHILIPSCVCPRFGCILPFSSACHKPCGVKAMSSVECCF